MARVIFLISMLLASVTQAGGWPSLLADDQPDRALCCADQLDNAVAKLTNNSDSGDDLDDALVESFAFVLSPHGTPSADLRFCRLPSVYYPSHQIRAPPRRRS